MKQTIRQLSDKLSETNTEAHITMIDMVAKLPDWSQIINK